MRNKLQKSFAKATALALAAVLMATSIGPASIADAKTKKPKLSKKSITVMVGKTKKVKLKNTKKIKKTKWSIKNKKIAKLTKKKKTSIVIKGKKAGKTTVTAKVTLKGKKKAVKLKLKVQVVKSTKITQKPETSSPSASPAASGKPGTSPMASNTPGTVPSNGPDNTNDPGNTNDPNASNQPTAVPDTLAILVPGERTGIKQGETLALTASGADSISWSVTGDTGATIDADGRLTVAKDVRAGTKLTITAQAAADSTKTSTKKLTVVENETPVLTDRNIQLNQTSAENLTGLTFRSDKAYLTVTDPERGEVVRFDASQGYTSSSYDVLAWMTVDPAWAGKTVTISAYMKYEASEDITGNMNLVINERWGYTNPAKKYSAEPDTWYHITGTYTLPEYKESKYNGDKNKLYICRDTEHMASGKNAVYYIDDLVFSVEKADIEKVTLTTESDQNEIYQNHDLQCSASVSGTGAPSQTVTYSIEPPVEGASITDKGLLSVKNAAPGAEINIKATSVEDPTKSDTKTVTVKEQTIDELTIKAAGNVTKVNSGSTLQFSTLVETTGDLATEVTWSIEPPVAGASISSEGLLSVGEQTAGTEITVAAVVSAVSDATKSLKKTYTVTILGDYVAPHEVKAVKSNQWDAFTDAHCANLSYNEEEGSVYYENGASNLATGSQKAALGFLINSDGSAFDASAYNVLTIRLSSYYKNTFEEYVTQATTLRVYSQSDTGYATTIPSVKEGSGLTRERVWRIPISDLAAAGVSLTDMKALSLEPSSATAGRGLTVYSFTFEKVAEFEPYKVSIEQPNKDKIVKEGRTLPLKAVVENQAKETLPDVKVEWSSSDETIATVSSDGVVTGVSAGEVVIMAKPANSRAMAFYDVTVYDDTPVAYGVQIGNQAVPQTSGGTLNFSFTEEELLAANGGVTFKGVKLNAGGEIVGEADDSQITVVKTDKTESDNYYGTTSEYQNGVLTAVLTGSGEKKYNYSTISMKVTSVTSGDETCTRNIKIYRGACRIPVTGDTVYNASAGKQRTDVTIDSNGYAAITGSESGSNGIGVKYRLPEGKKLSQYKKVLVGYCATASKYPLSLYMPENGWDTDAMVCGGAGTKLATSTTTNKTSDSYETERTYSLTLSETEADTDLVHFALGFGDSCQGELKIQYILLLE